MIIAWLIATAAASDAVPGAVVPTVPASVAAAMPAAQGLAVAATDYTGISIVIGAVVLGIIQIFNAWVAWRAKEDAAAAKASADKAAAQAETTAKAVDGKMTEVTKLIEEKVAAQATLIEKDAQRVREADKVLAGTLPHIIAPGNGGAAERSAAVHALLQKAAELMAAENK